MREKKREQMLIRLCTLLADAELADRRETIMHLMHSARRASRKRQSCDATDLCLDALKQLRKARNTLRVAGVGNNTLVPVEYAIAELMPVYDEARADANTKLFAESHVWLCLLILALLLVGLGAAVFLFYQAWPDFNWFLIVLMDDQSPIRWLFLGYAILLGIANVLAIIVASVPCAAETP